MIVYINFLLLELIQFRKGDENVPKIIWKGIIKSEDDFPTAKIPKNAIKIETEEDIKKMQLKALPFIIPSILICFICMFVKTFIANQQVIHIGFLLIGVLVGLLLLIVHEFLHAIAFPKNATVYIGIMPKSFAAVALSASPVKRNRLIWISILPIILGIIPLILFCIAPIHLKVFNGLMFGIAIMGMTSVYPDIYNIYHILKVVPRHASIQNNKNEMYYFESI